MVIARFPWRILSGKKRISEDRTTTKTQAIRLAMKWRRQGRKNVRVIRAPRR